MNIHSSYALVFSSAVAGVMLYASTPLAVEVTIRCVSEGQECIVPNTQTPIIYGKNGATVTTNDVTSIQCSNDAFGKDPLKGKGKACTYTIAPIQTNWTQCDKEGDKCSFNGAKLVRYGSNNWVYGSNVNGVNCDNKTFGDPDKGKGKRCEVSSN